MANGMKNPHFFLTDIITWVITFGCLMAVTTQVFRFAIVDPSGYFGAVGSIFLIPVVPCLLIYQFFLPLAAVHFVRGEEMPSRLRKWLAWPALLFAVAVVAAIVF